jgi:hypothetical protein
MSDSAKKTEDSQVSVETGDETGDAVAQEVQNDTEQQSSSVGEEQLVPSMDWGIYD